MWRHYSLGQKWCVSMRICTLTFLHSSSIPDNTWNEGLDLSRLSPRDPIRLEDNTSVLNREVLFRTDTQHVWSVIPNASAIKYSSQEILWLVIIPFTLNTKQIRSVHEIPGVHEYSEGSARRGHLCGHLYFMEDRFQSMITSLGYLLAQTCSCCPIEPWSFVPHLMTFTFPTSCPRHMRRTRPDLAVETKMFQWMGRRKCL